MSECYDTAIVGTGPAGLSAAITLKVRNKNIILFGKKKLSDKIEKAQEIKNYPGLPDITGEELAERYHHHIQKMQIEITPEMITTIYPMENGFGLLSDKNTMVEAKTVIIAGGISFGKPYPGEEEWLGKGVSYCATCDAALYRGKTVAVIGAMKEAEKEADFLNEVAGKVYYVPLYKGHTDTSAEIEVVHDRPKSIEGDTVLNRLVLDKRILETDGVFVLRESVRPSRLLPGIQMEKNAIPVNRRMETNIPGCYACGDITGAPYQYIKAAGEGNVAALSAVDYLMKN